MDPELREVAPSLAALFDAVVIAWESGVATPHTEGDGYQWTEWNFDAWAELKRRLLPPVRTVGQPPTRWLPRWLAIEGLDPADAVPRGRTTTIAALRGQAAGWVGVQTVAGTVTVLVGSGAASSVVLNDDTGQMVVYVPVSADPFRLMRTRTSVELDITTVDDVAYAPPFGGPFDAVATAVRREDAD